MANGMASEQVQAAPAIEAVAMARHVRASPQKIRLVVDMIRGQRAEDALQILRYTKKRATRDVEKVLRSAIANAERKAEDAGASLDVDHLFVSRCFVNEGSRWKRLRPAPMGRAFRYQRRTAHIVVGVVEPNPAQVFHRGPLTAAPPGSSSLPWPSTRFRVARHSLCPPRRTAE